MTGILGTIRRWIGLAALCALALTGPSVAQITDVDLADTGPVNEDYRDSTWRAGLDDEMLYIRPDATFSAEQVADADTKVEVKPRTEEDREAEATQSRWFWGIVFAVVLALLIVVFVMNAGGLTARFSSTDDRKRNEDDEPEQRPLGVAVDTSPVDQFLARLAAMSDRREALILLVSRALDDAAGANKLRLGRSQTARDAVRALPQGWPHWGGMRDLVRQAELVHFGGRDLPEERWQECLAMARPILGARA